MKSEICKLREGLDQPEALVPKAIASKIKTPVETKARIVFTRSQGAHIFLRSLGGASTFHVISRLLRGTLIALVITAINTIPHVDDAMSQNSDDVHRDLIITSHASAVRRAVIVKGGMNLT